MLRAQARAPIASGCGRRSARAARCGALAVRNSAFFSSGVVALRATPARPCVAAASRGASLSVEANLFERAFRVLRSYANALISSAEDPEKMLEQSVNEMQEDLIKMRQASAQVMASQKQLEAKYKQAQVTADDWYRRAQLALSKGDEELAREALTRRASYASSAEGMATQVTQQKDAVDKLIASTRMLEQKMAEARSKKDTLKARAASAKTSKKVSEMVGSMSTSSALGAFERMETKVLAMESEADAVAQLAAPDAVASKFLALESGSVDDELAKMKAGLLAGGSTPSLLSPPRKVNDAIEGELEALRAKTRRDNSAY